MLVPYTLEKYQKDPESAGKAVFRCGEKPDFVKAYTYDLISVDNKGQARKVYAHGGVYKEAADFCSPYDLVIDEPDIRIETYINAYPDGLFRQHRERGNAINFLDKEDGGIILRLEVNFTTGEVTVEKINP